MPCPPLLPLAAIPDGRRIEQIRSSPTSQHTAKRPEDAPHQPRAAPRRDPHDGLWHADGLAERPLLHELLTLDGAASHGPLGLRGRGDQHERGEEGEQEGATHGQPRA
jgi:hypothetical protein